jgi:hypothetical protein
MSKILTPEQFRKCPEGTVFAFGGEWNFGNLLILHDFMGPNENGGWGFYALDPMWVDADDSGEAFDSLDHMLKTGDSRPSQTASTKYMNYDGEKMDVFMVFEESDWLALRGLVEPAFNSKEPETDGSDHTK